MDAAPEIKRENINRFLCENCGADMAFDAASGGLLCSYCGHNRAVTATGRVDEQSYRAFLARGANALQPMAQNAMQARCDSCGAVVNFTPPETATECDFCGVRIVAQSKAADPLVAPHGVLPFRVTTKAAMEGFRIWLGSLWFAPSKLKHLAAAGKLGSIYIPYWTYDAMTVSDYTGMRGEYYTDFETYRENGQTKTRAVQKIRWYPASGTVSRHFDDVSVPATASLPSTYLERLEPWDFTELQPYEPAFLSGHKAQTYQVPLDGGFERFKEIAYDRIYQDCREDISGNVQNVTDIDTRYSDITFKHLLLPIYAGAYRFNGNTYQIVVNGRTGEVQGGRPYSWIKIGAFVIVLLILAAIVISVFSSR